MEQDGEKQKSRNRIVRNLAVAIIVVIVIAILLLVSYSLTIDPLRTFLGYVAVIFLPIIIILAYALIIAILHRRRPLHNSIQDFGQGK